MKIRKQKGKLWRLLLRLKVAWRLVVKERHGVCIYITDEQLTTLIKEDGMSEDIGMSYFGMMEYQSAQVIKVTAACIDDTEIICSKAEFEVYVQEQLNNKKK